MRNKHAKTNQPEKKPLGISENLKGLSQTQVKKNQTQITKAEREARGAEFHATMAKARAGKVKVGIGACVHKLTVITETIQSLSKKAESEAKTLATWHTAEALAVDAKHLALAKKEEVRSEGRRLRALVVNKNAEARKAKTAYEKENALQEARHTEEKATKIENEAHRAEKVARQKSLEAKKAKLEAEEASAAKKTIAKYAAIEAATEKELNTKRIEFEDREAEAKARTAQAMAKRAEANAIKAGNIAEAEEKRLEARIHKLEAIAKCNEIAEKRESSKPRKQVERQPKATVTQVLQRQTRCAERKHLSAKGLHNIVHESFQAISNRTRVEDGKKSKITLSDCLMSGLAVFGLKYPSLLQFDKDSQEGGCIHNNLKMLYQVNQVPSDTYMRERLDNVDQASLYPAFNQLFAQVQRGKDLEEYAFMDGYFLMSGDGSGYFSSKTLHCKDCCTKCHRDGSQSYYHQMMSAAIVHPDHPTVLPFCPEPITNADGSEKNDCERNASERLYRRIRREHPHLKIIVTEDALGSNGPHLRLLQELNMRFIIVVKPDGNKAIFEYLKGINCEKIEQTTDEFTYKINFINKIPLNDSNHNLEVNYLELAVYNKNGDLEYHNSWVTDILITKYNAYQLCQGGRAKWKIENETFNTLKNQGYHFEHNFGHGFNHLSTIFASLMFLAFLIDQIQQSCCGLFKEALTKMGSRKRLWERMRAYFMTLFIDSWEDFLLGIAFGVHGGRLTPLKRSQAPP
jgi:hypothetical protein